mmetsp:Transcript_29590/g.83407  ORF Transcript_29590/g.83407 Transcript_29590/m.83407 type:complete len:242 (-) Transcript_29590:1612-2337(-)
MAACCSSRYGVTCSLIIRVNHSDLKFASVLHCDSYQKGSRTLPAALGRTFHKACVFSESPYDLGREWPRGRFPCQPTCYGIEMTVPTSSPRVARRPRSRHAKLEPSKANPGHCDAASPGSDPGVLSHWKKPQRWSRGFGQQWKGRPSFGPGFRHTNLLAGSPHRHRCRSLLSTISACSRLQCRMCSNTLKNSTAYASATSLLPCTTTIFSSFVSMDAREKFAEPDTMIGASEKGSTSRIFV